MLGKVTTAEQLLAMPDDGLVYELVRGELRRMSPAGEHHGHLAMRIGARLAMHVDARRLGRVYAAETGFILARQPDTVMAPDVAFVRRSRVGVGRRHGYFVGPPDLAVEVRSPGDSRREVGRKAAEWLAFGCPVVWIVDASKGTVTVYREGATALTLGRNDVLDGGEAVPGFALALAELFAG